MYPVFEWMERILPEYRMIFRRRFRILYELQGPIDIGRRVLSVRTGFSEAVLRRDCGVLIREGLIRCRKDGMCLTPEGVKWLEDARSWRPEVYEAIVLEKKLEYKLPGWHVYLGLDGVAKDCEHIRTAQAALRELRPKPEVERMLRQRDAYCEWNGCFYDAAGRLLYRSRTVDQKTGRLCVDEEIHNAQVLSVLLEGGSGAVWMSEALGRCLWEIH